MYCKGVTLLFLSGLLLQFMHGTVLVESAFPGGGFFGSFGRFVDDAFRGSGRGFQGGRPGFAGSGSGRGFSGPPNNGGGRFPYKRAVEDIASVVLGNAPVFEKQCERLGIKDSKPCKFVMCVLRYRRLGASRAGQTCRAFTNMN